MEKWFVTNHNIDPKIGLAKFPWSVLLGVILLLLFDWLSCFGINVEEYARFKALNKTLFWYWFNVCWPARWTFVFILKRGDCTTVKAVNCFCHFNAYMVDIMEISDIVEPKNIFLFRGKKYRFKSCCMEPSVTMECISDGSIFSFGVSASILDEFVAIQPDESISDT